MSRAPSQRIALVTGANGGIGRAIALGLADGGVGVCIHYFQGAEEAEATCRDIDRTGRASGAIQGDLSDIAFAQDLVPRTQELMGSAPSILVCNASAEFRRAFSDITVEEAHYLWQLNFLSTVLLFQQALPAMKQESWGRLLTIGSIQERVPHPEMAVYAALKSAQANLVVNLACQVASEGITANNLSPGAIETNRTRSALADATYRDKVLERIPAGRLGTPDDLAGAAVFLCSDAARYITGQTLYVTGGMHA